MREAQELTMEALRDRMRAPDVTIAEPRLAIVRRLLDDALAPLRTLDTRTIKTVEPAVLFTPGQETRHE